MKIVFEIATGPTVTAAIAIATAAFVKTITISSVSPELGFLGILTVALTSLYAIKVLP